MSSSTRPPTQDGKNQKYFGIEGQHQKAERKLAIKNRHGPSHGRQKKKCNSAGAGAGVTSSRPIGVKSLSHNDLHGRRIIQLGRHSVDKQLGCRTLRNVEIHVVQMVGDMQKGRAVVLIRAIGRVGGI